VVVKHRRKENEQFGVRTTGGIRIGGAALPASKQHAREPQNEADAKFSLMSNEIVAEISSKYCNLRSNEEESDVPKTS
jgi:hypothetical protein